MLTRVNHNSRIFTLSLRDIRIGQPLDQTLPWTTLFYRYGSGYIGSSR